MSDVHSEELRKQVENKLYMTDHSVYYEMRAFKPGDNREYGGKSFDGKIAMDNIMQLISTHTQQVVKEARIDELERYMKERIGHIRESEIISYIPDRIQSLNETGGKSDE